MVKHEERRIRIAHVDDSEADSALLEIMLERSNIPPHNVTHFPCPQRALESGLTGYELIVTDHDMPAMTGSKSILTGNNIPFLAQ